MEEELRLVRSLLRRIVDAIDVEFPGGVIGPSKDRGLERNAIADLPPIFLRRVDADDGARAIGEPCLLLIVRQIELRVHSQPALGVDRHVGKLVLRFLVVAAEPVRVRDVLDALDRPYPVAVALGQRHDDRNLVQDHQSIGASKLDPHAEGRAHRHQHAEQHERREDGQHGEDRADLPPQQVAPDDGQELHAAASVTSTPLSRCSVRFARAAACGSCVTMTIVLP